ncbi:MAG: choice-of-anchor D domain-containing protein [Candidatus Marinimicrobia bacterium]|nr:choice-of-anchor D domain-containing protein [Candidatus Neomarinimicrobiota bacterium]
MKRIQFSMLVVSVLILTLSLPAFGQWAVSTGTRSTQSIQETPDGGYIVASGIEFGLTVKKLDDAGQLVWQNRYYYNTYPSYKRTGFSRPFINSPIRPTADGGYIVATGIDRQDNGTYGAGYCDIWVLKLDSDGDVEWQKTYGSQDYYEYPADMEQTADGGYVIAGRMVWHNPYQQPNCWVLKLDPQGGIEWEKAYGNYSTSSIEQTPDNGYIVAGVTSTQGAGGFDAWVFKLNADGDIEPGLQKTFGGSGDDWARVIKQTSDGGYIMGGQTCSFNIQPDTSACMWVLKLDASLVVQWQKTYGGSSLLPGSSGVDQTEAWDIVETSDGDFIVTGTTSHFGHGTADAWILKLDVDDQGNILWQHTYGGMEDAGDYYRRETFATVLETSTGDIVTGGASFTYPGWMLSLDANGEIPGCGLMGDSAAIVTDSNATVHDTLDVAEDTAAITGLPPGVAQPWDAERILFCPDGVDLSVTIDDTPDPVRPDNYYAYIMTAANEGSAPATGVTVTADIPAGAAFFSATASQGTSSESGGTVTFDVGDLAGYAKATLTIIVRAGASGDYALTAAIDGNEIAADPDLANNTYTESTSVTPWLNHTVGQTDPNPFGMAVDSNGFAHFAWVYYGKLMYGTNASGRWLSWALADSGQVTSADVAVDGANNIHIVYGENYASLKYIRNTDGTWSDPQIVSDAAGTAWALSMAIGADNSVHMTFLDCGPACASSLFYATNHDQTPGQWATTAIHPAAYDFAALALDSDNHAHVSFYSMEVIPGDYTTGGIGYLTNAPAGDWQPAEEVDEEWAGCQLEGMVTDIVVDADNMPHIVYAGDAYGNYNEDTQYASRETGAWVTDVIEEGECVSWGKSMAIDESGNVYVGYFHVPTLSMKIADKTTGGWTLRTLADGGNYNAMTVDRYGQVHIGYTDDQGRIIYAAHQTMTDADGDGVGDEEEDAAPNSGDGNSDGIADSGQSRVTSLETSDGQQFVTLVAPADTVLTQVRSVVNPSPADAPENTDFLYGFFDFILLGAEIGQSTTVDLILPDASANTYFKYGPTRDQPENHWYSFADDGQTGATAAGSTMILTFMDGQRGDADLAANGIIQDPGGPSDGPVGQQHIQVSPASLDFGDVEIETTADLSLEIMNTGTDDLYVNGIADPDAPFAVVGDFCSGNTLSPGASCETLVRFSPTEAGNSYAELSITSNDPAFPVVVVPLSGAAVPVAEPAISVSPINLDFGDIAVGSTEDLSVTVTNKGFSTLHLGDVAALATPYSIITDNVSGAVLSAGDVAALTVRFSPTSPGVMNDSLDIPSDDPDQPLVTVSLSGNGIGDDAPDISVTPESLDFGGVTVGQAADLSLTIANSGSDDLLINGVSALAAPFSRITDTCGGQTLAPGSECSIAIRFSPSTEAAFLEQLWIFSSDPDEGTVSVDLSGQGLAAENPAMSVSPDALDFGDVATSDTFTISNAGTGVVSWTISPALPDWVTVAPMSGDTAAGPSTVTVTVDRSQAQGSGIHNTNILISSNGGNASVFVQIEKPNASDPVAVATFSPDNAPAGDPVQLDATESYDPDGDAIATYQWSWEFDPDTETYPPAYGAYISDSNSPTPILTSPGAGEQTVALTVSDGTRESARDVITIHFTDNPSPNTPPIADAGGDQTADVGESLNLDGTGSYDPDGSPIVDYNWTLVGYEAEEIPPMAVGALLTDAQTATPTFSCTRIGRFFLSLVVTDSRRDQSDPDLITITVQTVRDDTGDHSDADGIPDADELGPDGAEFDYDGNGDGIPDRTQPGVASLHTQSGLEYVSLASSGGTFLSNVETADEDSIGNLPVGYTFPFQLFSFTINNVDPGGTAIINLYLPDGTDVERYFKYGPTPGNTAPHWYEFMWDGTTGAQINGNIVTLTFVDGQRGDSDLDGTNGMITDPGGPAIKQASPAPSGDSGGGCFVNSIF